MSEDLKTPAPEKPVELTPKQKLERKLRELRNKHFQECATLGDFHYFLVSLPDKITRQEDMLRNTLLEIEKVENKLKMAGNPPVEAPVENAESA